MLEEEKTKEESTKSKAGRAARTGTFLESVRRSQRLSEIMATVRSLHAANRNRKPPFPLVVDLGGVAERAVAISYHWPLDGRAHSVNGWCLLD